MPSTEAISYGRYSVRFRRQRDQFPGIGFRIPEAVKNLATETRRHRVKIASLIWLKKKMPYPPGDFANH